MRMTIALLWFTLLLAPRSSVAETWATLKGRFVFDGEMPKKKLLAVPAKSRANHGLPADFRLPDERLLVDEETKGIGNILVYAAHDRSKSKNFMPYFEDSKEKASSDHVIQFQKLSYSPRISFMRTSQKLVVANMTTIPMILQYQPPSEKRSRYQINAGGQMAKYFGESMATPLYLDHGINDALSGWVLIRDNPYVAITNAKGEFEIKNLPIGAWEFIAWHEKAQTELKVKISQRDETWRKGRFLATIEKEGTDLGELVVSEQSFK